MSAPETRTSIELPGVGTVYVEALAVALGDKPRELFLYDDLTGCKYRIEIELDLLKILEGYAVQSINGRVTDLRTRSAAAALEKPPVTDDGSFDAAALTKAWVEQFGPVNTDEIAATAEALYNLMAPPVAAV
jgi:hypothetical protein